MFKFIYAIGAKEGKVLSPAQIKKVAKSLFKSGIEVSEDTVKSKIREFTA